MTSKDHYVKKYVDAHDSSFRYTITLGDHQGAVAIIHEVNDNKIAEFDIIGSPVRWMGTCLTRSLQMNSVAQETHSSSSRRMATASNNQILFSRTLALSNLYDHGGARSNTK